MEPLHYYLDWTSTFADRYNSEMNERADHVVEHSGIKVLDRYGGSDGEAADNGYLVEAGFEDVVALAQFLANAVEYPVTVTDRYIRGSVILTMHPQEVP